MVKTIFVLSNGHEIKMSTLSGQSLPEAGSTKYIYWDIGDAVLMHSISHHIIQTVENVDLGKYVASLSDEQGV